MWALIVESSPVGVFRAWCPRCWHDSGWGPDYLEDPEVVGFAEHTDIGYLFCSSCQGWYALHGAVSDGLVSDEDTCGRQLSKEEAQEWLEERKILPEDWLSFWKDAYFFLRPTAMFLQLQDPHTGTTQYQLPFLPLSADRKSEEQEQRLYYEYRQELACDHCGQILVVETWSPGMR